MKNILVLAAVGCVLFLQSCDQNVSVPPQSHPDTSQWHDLFDADMSDAIFPEGVWTFDDGFLTTSEDQCLWTKKEYDNFIIDLELHQLQSSKQDEQVPLQCYVYNSHLRT